MIIRAENGPARIRLTDGTIVEVESDELDWDGFGGGAGTEHDMGPRSMYRAKREFDDGSSVTWELTEYPANALNYTQTLMEGAEVLKDFTFRLEPEPDDDA